MMTQVGPGVTTDRELVLAFQRGDLGAYNAIYTRHAGVVRALCRRYLADSGQVQESTQETFLKAFRGLDRFKGDYQLGAWLKRIAYNVCMDHLRGHGQNPRLVALGPEHEAELTELGPDEVILSRNPRVDLAIERLIPLHQEVLRLRVLGDYSHVELAARLGMTTPQVKALLHRARTSFRRAWNDDKDWVAHQFLIALGDAGVLQAFLRTSTRDQTSFQKLIHSAEDHKIRLHRTETLISALKASLAEGQDPISFPSGAFSNVS